MALFFTLAGVAIIPILIVTLFPKRQEYFERTAVRGFGLGVYLILVLILLKEAVEVGGALVGFSWFGVGLLVSFLIGLSLKEFHHHHSAEEKEASHNQSSTWRVLISDFFHNIVDGIAIIAGFNFGTEIGVIAFLGVLGHQIIQQAGQQILLVESGIMPKRAIFISALIALSIFLGFLFVGNESLEVILLSLSAGIVAWKVAIDIVHTKWSKKLVAGFALGAFLLTAILLLVPHSHEYEEEGAHEDEHEEEESGHEEEEPML